MNRSYQDGLDNTNEDLLAQLTISIDKNEEFGYSCNWDATDKGIRALSSIFYGIAYDDLMEKILNELKAQCVLEGNEGDFLSMVEHIKNFIVLSDNDKEDAPESVSGDSLAVSPRDVLKL